MVSFGAIAKRLPPGGAELLIQFRNMPPGLQGLKRFICVSPLEMKYLFFQNFHLRYISLVAELK